MIGDETLSLFTEHVESRFSLRWNQGEPVDLVLAEAKPLARGGKGQGRDPFSLIFRGPRWADLPQGTYQMDHDALGSIELFLVPIGPLGDSHARHFEAIFN